MWAFRFLAQNWPVDGPALAHGNLHLCEVTIGCVPALEIFSFELTRSI